MTVVREPNNTRKSSSPIKKVRNMATFGTEEFIIDASKVILVERHLNKVERLFIVKVSFDKVSVVGENKNQWLVVSGNKENRRKASLYVQAMCNPEQVSFLKVDVSHFLDDALLEEVEQMSNAFIQRTGPLTLEVKGSELMCVLALSQLEQTYRVTLTDVKLAEQETIPEAEGTEPQTPSPTAALVESGVKDLAVDKTRVSLHPHTHTQPHPQQLFGPGDSGLKSTPSSRPNPLSSSSYSRLQTSAPVYKQQAALDTRQSFALHHTAEQQQQRTGSATVPAAVSQTSGGALNHSSVGETGRFAVVQQTDEGSAGVDGKTESRVDELQGAGDKEWETQKSKLQELGARMGYSQQDMDNTFLFFDFSQQKVQTHEFLTALDQVRSSRQMTESEKHGSSSGSDKVSPSRPSSSSSSTASAAHKGKGKQKSGKGRKASPAAAATTHPGKAKPSTGASPSHSQPTVKPVLMVTPEKKQPSSSFPSDSSVILLAEEGINDSVIFMGEEKNNDDSVCVVDPSPVPSSSCSVKRPFTGSPPCGFSAAVRQRKDFSEDQDQTAVLKPYRVSHFLDDCNTVAKGSSSRQGLRLLHPQVADLVADLQTGPASTSSDVVAATEDSELRYVVIDGCNVAMSHGNGQVFSCRGIQICVDYFLSRGHKVKVLVPLTKTYQNKAGGRHPPVCNQEILDELKKQGLLGYTPARTLNHRHIVSHDDPIILELAQREDGVIVSNDNFTEFLGEFAFLIENRVLSYVFLDDHFMLPRDPLGRYGPTREEILRKSPANPQQQAVADRRGRAPPNQPMFPTAARRPHSTGREAFPIIDHWQKAPPRRGGSPQGGGGGLGRLVCSDSAEASSTAPLRHEKVTEQLLEALKAVFPEDQQEPKIRQVLDNHCTETDLNKLTNYCIAALSL